MARPITRNTPVTIAICPFTRSILSCLPAESVEGEDIRSIEAERERDREP